MKKTMKITIITLLMLVSTLGVFATESHTHDSSQIEVIFNENTAFTEIQKQNITTYLTGESTPRITTMANLICILLGHDRTVECVTATQHSSYATAPRCLRETYDISTCSRCDYISSSLILAIRTTCCS